MALFFSEVIFEIQVIFPNCICSVFIGLWNHVLYNVGQRGHPIQWIYSLPVCWPSFVTLWSINIWLELVRLTNFLLLKINHGTFSWQLGIIPIWEAFWTTTFFPTLICIIQLSSCCEKSLGLGWQLPGKEYQCYSANRMKEVGS